VLLGGGRKGPSKKTFNIKGYGDGKFIAQAGRERERFLSKKRETAL